MFLYEIPFFTVLIVGYFCETTFAGPIPWQHGPFHSSDGDVPLRFFDSYAETNINCVASVTCNGPLDVSLHPNIVYCSQVVGNVVVSGPVKYIPGCLIQITEGDLIVEKNTFVSSTYGFGRLRRIDGNLRIQGNPHLTSLWGLESLEEVTGDVYISFNGEFISLSSLDALVYAQGDSGNYNQDASRRIYDVDKTGQSTFTAPIDDKELHFARRARRVKVSEASDFKVDPLETTYFYEDKLDALTWFKGLVSLKRILGDFYIVGNSNLVNMKGVEGLNIVMGSVYVERNPSLISLEGFDNLTIIGKDLVLLRNDNLHSLDYLKGLKSIGGDLKVLENSQLVEIGYLRKLEEIGGSFAIRRNWNLKAISLTGGLALKTINESFVLNDNNKFFSSAGLENLTTIGGDLEIYRNTKFLSLSPGFLKLTNVGGTMYVQGHFENYLGLNSLQQVHGNVIIHSLPILFNLAGLESLERVGKDFLAYLNPSLNSISELVSLKYIGGSFKVYNNEKLEHIENMLEALYYVQGYLQIDYMNATIDCPRGTGTLNGQTSMIDDDTPANLSYGNWCTMNCAYPRNLHGNNDMGRPKRMWNSRFEDVWSKKWGPYCS